MKKYSNVICVGDSYTNELDFYKSEGHWETFKEAGYEYKSYPQMLGEYYNCKWETFGEPGMPMIWTLQTLIDKIPYILSLENPLVIYQYGFFTNLILHVEEENWVNWKSLVSENLPKQQFQTTTKFGVISRNGEGMTDIEDKLLLLDYTKRFGEQTNYWIIQYFCTIADILTKLGKPNIYSMFVPRPDFKLPKHKNIIPYLEDCTTPLINEVLPQVNDTHKSTEANQKITDNIVKYMSKNLEM